MARLSKHCPTCKRTQRVDLVLVPGGATSEWHARCKVCGTEMPPDGPVLKDQAEIDAWLATQRAQGVTP